MDFQTDIHRDQTENGTFLKKIGVEEPLFLEQTSQFWPENSAEQRH